MIEFFESARRLEAEQTPFAVVTLIESTGHTPQDAGARAIISESGLIWGTLGGGKVEARAIAKAQELMRSTQPGRAPTVIRWNLQTDIGMTCGGVATYLFEVFGRSPWKIGIFGAGHVAQALVRTLLPMDCHITCCDSRADWLEKLPPSPRLFRVASCSGNEEALVDDMFFVLITQGHTTDLAVLEVLEKRFPAAPFVGVIGSEVKAMKLRKQMRDLGFRESFVNRVRCPIGMKFGNNHPFEIAISITAELLTTRDIYLENHSSIEAKHPDL